MSFNFSKYIKTQEGYYGPTTNENLYESIYYHRKKAKPMKGKNRWTIEEEEEFGVFKSADENEWLCKEQQAFFSIIEKGKVLLGTDGERLAMFRVPVNGSNIYHGFPVLASEHRPSSELLDEWQANGVVTRPIRMRIEKSQL